MLMWKESDKTRINEMLQDGSKERTGMMKVKNMKSKKDVGEILGKDNAPYAGSWKIGNLFQ